MFDKKKWREENKEKLRLQDIEYRERNKEKIKEYRKKYYQENKEKISVVTKKYALKNREKLNLISKKWNKEHPQRRKELARKSWLKQYGLSLEEYNTLLENQNNQCCICGNVAKENKYLAVDHDHITGRVRGLLCETCNVGLGSLKDSVEILYAAIEYLSKKE